ncbi:ArsR/SmtB family transcription factor [Oryzobacter terrae]|uniref:ArsR/SmtB family transcription factor n=1 Tax=Oryzobacter terrae TaxID=1620385 RepID=UPI00366D90E4
MDAFDAIADPVRRALLTTVSQGSARVVDLAAAHPISRPAVSRHLRVLTEAGLVTVDAVGRERHYRLRPEPLDDVRTFLDALASSTRRPPVTPEALDALDLEVRRVGRDRRDGPSTEATTTTTTTTTPTEETA